LSSSAATAAAVGLLLLASSAPAAAQDPPTDVVRDAMDGGLASPFLSRADFAFGWAGLMTGDRRFDWQATIGFDLDVYDYSSGRLRLRGDYEAVLGRERRRYDLNQGTYAFEISGSRRFKHAEVAVLSQHVSRHVVDRDNPPAISWNTLGGRVQSTWARRSTRVDGEIELSRAMQQAYVDYAWLSRARLSWRRAVTAAITVHATGTGEVIGVKRGVVRDERVCGGRIEGGVAIRGGAATLEIFGGYERRIDAYPTDRFRVRWFTAGARVVTTPSW
jgi:hypothetical protein